MLDLEGWFIMDLDGFILIRVSDTFFYCSRFLSYSININITLKY
jgi:hypothetical protein